MLRWYFKLLRSPGIYSKESIPPGFVARRAGTTTLFLLGSYSPHSLLYNSSTVAASGLVRLILRAQLAIRAEAKFIHST
jgi:hypothetical protein